MLTKLEMDKVLVLIQIYGVVWDQVFAQTERQVKLDIYWQIWDHASEQLMDKIREALGAY